MPPAQKSGFTLIELLVVIAIIGVLSAVGLTAYSTVAAKGRDSKRIQDLKALGTALEVYYSSNGSYPTSASEGCSSANSDSFYTAIQPFMNNQSVPIDPKTQQKYCYYAVTGNRSYRLFAALEDCNSSNISGCATGDSWNYSVASPDLSLVTASGAPPATPPPGGGSNPTPPPGGGSNPTPPPGGGSSPTPAPITCPSSGLVAYWKMNESSWTNDCSTASVMDSSGNGINGIVCNGTSPQAGKLGNGGYFGASQNNYINVGSNNVFNFGSGNFSISLWFKTSSWGSTNTYSGFLSKYALNGGTWNLFNLEGTGLVFTGLRSNSTVGVFNQRIPTNVVDTYADGNWHHLVAMRDSDTSAKIYIDNTALGSPFAGYNSGGTLEFLSSVPVYIGNYGPTYPTLSAFPGSIDEVGIWNRALTITEIANLYNNRQGVTCP